MKQFSVKPWLVVASLLLTTSCAATSNTTASTAVPPAATPNNEVKDEAGFNAYVAALKQEALQRGYPKKLVNQVFSSLKYHPHVVKADKGQPEFVETLDTYLPKRVNEWRIKQARLAYEKYQPELQQLSKQYGVPGRFIIALWGLESSFGKITGNYSVPSSLATLAYEGRREEFFRTEFFLALDILREGHISLKDMKGSWAGAMGHTQFMPSAFVKYAQDGDGDGHKDIWTNRRDAFASIANYLKTEGWRPGENWGRQVKLPENFDYSLVIPKGSKNRAQWLEWWQAREKSLATWKTMGLKNIDGSALPSADIPATVVMPDDKEGRAYLAYRNYQTLMHWNRSYYFVSSVGYLADAIIAKP
ncbi:MAG TPA: lytic murein transglycosylase [Rheinheimera sp.]|nr:lytic murein transglycosylase [Rheinheimera sp.]